MRDLIKTILRKQINFITIKDIKEDYPKLKAWGDTHAMSLFEDIQNEQILTEFLHTVSDKLTLSQLIKSFGEDIEVTAKNQKGENKIIEIKFNNILTVDLDKVNALMDKFGWFPAYIMNGWIQGKYTKMINSVKEYSGVVIQYEAKYDLPIDVSDKQFLYHITADVNYVKIKHSGLTPKSQSKLSNHPNRVYLFDGLSEEYINDLAYNLYRTNVNKERIGKMYLLQIDLSKLNGEYLFFDDPAFFYGQAVWTYQNIPPSAITFLKEINIKMM